MALPPRVKKPRNRYHHGSLRDAALQAAALDIDANGHQGFTLERVAKALRVTPAALYRHFENREDLLREVIWSVFQRFVERLDAATLSASEPREVVRAMGRAYVCFALENPGWFRLQFTRAGLALSDRQRRVQPRYKEASVAALGRITGNEGQELKTDFTVMWAMFHGVASMAIDRSVSSLETDEAWLMLTDQSVQRLIDGLSR